MIMTFTGDLLKQIQCVRYQNTIEKIKNSEILEFSLNDWNNFSDSNEIKFKNNFYDVISIQKLKSKIFANVVKDKLESELRITFSKIFNKTKIPTPGNKKLNSFSKHVLFRYEFVRINNLHFLSKKLQENDNFLNSKTSNFINFQYKPPC